MAANTEYTKIKESTISAFFTKLKNFFWPQSEVVTLDVIEIDLADVAVTGDYDDLDNKPNLSAKEDTSNKVTSLSAASTDTEYPSAKCVYDIVGDIETLLAAI